MTYVLKAPDEQILKRYCMTQQCEIDVLRVHSLLKRFGFFVIFKNDNIQFFCSNMYALCNSALYAKLVFTAYYHLAKPTVRKNPQGFIEASLQDLYPTRKSCLQSMVYQSPYAIKIHFQSQYTYTFMRKVRIHVQFHCVSRTSAILKTGCF